MPATITKNASIQVRVPEETKSQLTKHAEKMGLSLSEYIRFLVLSQTEEGKQAIAALQFWKEVEATEAEHKAGKGVRTSAADLIRIAHNARKKK